MCGTIICAIRSKLWVRFGTPVSLNLAGKAKNWPMHV
jgi:hypothetical protein